MQIYHLCAMFFSVLNEVSAAAIALKSGMTFAPSWLWQLLG
jgi:hypothetical protein